MILAFGDSLTYGFGVRRDLSYPALLEKKTGIQVLNAGINGSFSFQGLSRLPRMLAHKPELVIVCYGANDLLNNFPVNELKNNLIGMIELIKGRGSKVVLVGVPDFSIFDSAVANLYYEVAKECKVILDDKTLTQIVSNPSLHTDGVHPNAKGYQLMADSFYSLINSTFNLN